MFLLFFLLENLFLTLINLLFGGPTDWFILIIIIFNSVIILMYATIKLKNKSIISILLIGYGIRVILLIIRSYVNDLGFMGWYQSDAVRFDNVAREISNDLSLLNETLYGQPYSKFVGVFYHFLGDSLVLAEFFNIILSVVIAVYVLKILDCLYINIRGKVIVLLLLSLIPYSIVFSVVLMREQLVIVCFVFSIYHFLKWMENKSALSISLSIIALLISSSLHAGVAAALMIYAFFFAFYDRNKNKLKTNMFNIVSAIILGLFIIFIFTTYKDVLFSKFAQYDSMDSVYEKMEQSGGGSAYLTNLSINNIFDFTLYTPIKTVYFLFSPMPWGIRGIQDIIAIGLDSIFYIFLVTRSIKNYRRIVKVDNKVLLLILVFIVCSVVFSVGTFTSGTALRHRLKLLPILLCIFVALDKKYLSKWKAG